MRNSQTQSRTSNIDAVSIALLVMIVLAILIRIIDPIFYDLHYQHDARFHIADLISLMNGQVPAYYAPPIYLAWYLIHKALIPSFWSVSMTPDQQMKAFVGLGNLTLFFGLLLGLYFLGKQLGLSRRQILLWLALTGAMVPLNRSLSMVRPENIQLALAPWIFLTGMNWFREMERRGVFPINLQFIVFQLLCGVEIFQKIGGVAVVITSYLSLLIFTKVNKKNFRNIIISSFITAIIFAAFAAGWYKVSGNFLFDHPANKISGYSYSAPLSFFVSFPMTEFVKTPYRFELRSSMAAILLADFYGDYWRYGYNQYKFTQSPMNDFNMRTRQRLGNIVSFVFFLVLTAICILTGKEAITKKIDGQKKLTVLVLGLLPLVFGLIYLGLSSQIYFNPEKGDIAKWEYILFAIPFLLLPLVNYASPLKNKWLHNIFYVFCFFLIMFGLTQSLYIL